MTNIDKNNKHTTVKLSVLVRMVMWKTVDWKHIYSSDFPANSQALSNGALYFPYVIVWVNCSSVQVRISIKKKAEMALKAHIYKSYSSMFFFVYAAIKWKKKKHVHDTASESWNYTLTQPVRTMLILYTRIAGMQ